MKQLSGKHILLGVTGSIAAYKSAELVRLLRQAGAGVRVVMTRGAGAFITPLTLQALSGHPVHSELLDAGTEAAMGHIELARWADAVLVAPASADFIARLAQGRANDLLAAICLASEAPLAVAPAMNRAMWGNAATVENVDTLRRRGIRIMGPAQGSQACGESGPGRLLEPGELLAALATLFNTGSLAGCRVMVTAGPTREAIDPVRYISNRSSGKMGFAVAAAAMEEKGFRPGAVSVVQTFGDRANFHPHVHALVTHLLQPGCNVFVNIILFIAIMITRANHQGRPLANFTQVLFYDNNLYV